MLSLIIPVYNCEDVINKCVHSFISDKIDMEIILINDGSTDNSQFILNELQKTYSNIKIINQKNRGAALARNAGLQIAKGDYIGFVDADDFVDKNYFSEMYEYAVKMNLDMVLGNVKSKNRDAYIPYEDKVILKQKSIRESIIPLVIGPTHEKDIEKVLPCAMWAYLFKKSMLQKYNLKFIDVKNGQDSLFTLESLCHARSLGICKNVYYHYEDNENSLSKQYTFDRYERLVKNSEIIESILHSNKIEPYPYYQISQLDRHHVYFVCRQIAYQNIKFKQKKELLKQVFEVDRTNKAWDNFFWKECSFQMKILYFFMKKKLITVLLLLIFLKDKFL